jgi:hypothetical protein
MIHQAGVQVQGKDIEQPFPKLEGGVLHKGSPEGFYQILTGEGQKRNIPVPPKLVEFIGYQSFLEAFKLHSQRHRPVVPGGFGNKHFSDRGVAVLAIIVLTVPAFFLGADKNGGAKKKNSYQLCGYQL